MMRLLPEERPVAFDLLSPPNQRIRGRYFLMTWAWTGSEPYSWFMALQVDRDNIKAIEDLVAATPDERIAQAVQWREAPLAAGQSALLAKVSGERATRARMRLPGYRLRCLPVPIAGSASRPDGAASYPGGRYCT